jgi:hypothetical protein
VYGLSRAGVQMMIASAGFAPPSEPVIGNGLPPWTGSPGNTPNVPGPHPPTQPMGGNQGNFDGYSGADPYAPKISPCPRRVAPVIEGQTGGATGPPLGYGEGADRIGPGASGASARLNAPNREGLVAQGRQSFRRFGVQGFNDQLQVRDRHAYWDRGDQKTGIDGVAHGLPNSYNPDIRWNRATPELRTVNISVNPMIGSDATRSQDDLSRPYTWLGQQDGTTQVIYGGVPGLWAEYGNRGLPQNIHDPSNGEGGPANVYSGPPHGLHSDTVAGVKLTLDRYKSTPQMRPVRLDRPSNSTSAGQSYSQTVQMQGQGSPAAGATSASPGLSFRIGTRSWGGA